MPSIFKVLATISAWLLFIIGVGSLVVMTIAFITSPVEEVYDFNDVTWAAVTVLSLFLGVVAMQIRKNLEK